MAKDPAFLFYPGNWLKGTQLFSRSHKGAYMDILMAQFSNGHLLLDDIKQLLGVDYETMWESKLKSKFVIDDKGLYYNDFMESVMINREEYTKGRLNNLKGKKSSHKGTHKDSPYEEPICSNANANTIKDVKENTWREDFNIYKNLIISAFEELKKDNVELNKQQEFYPKANIVKSIEKGIHNFWGNEAGWKHKKKSRLKEIDCRSTLINSIKMNIVYSDDNEKPKEKNAYIEYMEKKKRGMTDEEIGIENSDG